MVLSSNHLMVGTQMFIVPSSVLNIGFSLIWLCKNNTVSKIPTVFLFKKHASRVAYFFEGGVVVGRSWLHASADWIFERHDTWWSAPTLTDHSNNINNRRYVRSHLDLHKSSYKNCEYADYRRVNIKLEKCERHFARHSRGTFLFGEHPRST